MIDRPEDEAPQPLSATGQALTASITYPEEGAAGADRFSFGGPGEARARHEFGDTKFRRVTYRAVATSRFEEQFRSPGGEPRSTTRETPGEERATVVVPSTARPAAPQVLYALPIFGWTPPRRRDRFREGTTIQHRRIGGGLRVYLGRPWYSSGDEERLAVVLWPGAEAFLRGSLLQRAAATVGVQATPDEIPSKLKPLVSQWGMDPLLDTSPLREPLGAKHFLNAEPADPEAPAAFTLGELEDGGSPNLFTIASFVPRFDRKRRIWFCDLHLDTAGVYFPFVRLALARYQPHSLEGRDAGGARIGVRHLSPVVLADFVQLPADRSVTLVRERSSHRLQVTVEGPAFRRSGAGAGATEIEIALEKRHESSPGGWVPVPGKVARLTPVDDEPSAHVWSGRLALDRGPVYQRFRLAIREYEIHRGDHPEPVRRLVYADVLEL